MGFPGAFDKTDNGRQLTSKLWRDFNPAAIHAEPGRGWMSIDDFHTISDENHVLTQGGSAGTATLSSTLANGVLVIDAADSDDGDGANVQFFGLGATPAAGAIVAFECRMQVSTLTDDFFVGMGGGSATAILDTLPTDYAGFRVIDNGADWTYGQQDGDPDTEADVYTAEAATYAKIGFRLNGLETTEIYVNGEEVANTLTVASIPNLVIWPILACESAGTNVPTLSADWMSVGYLAP